MKMAVQTQRFIHFTIILAFTVFLSVVTASETNRKFNKVERYNVNEGGNNLLVDLKPGTNYEMSNPTSRGSSLSIFCWSGEESRVVNIFKTVLVQLKINASDFILYRGENVSHVEQQHKEMQKSWFSLLPWKTREFHFSPFRKSCFGVFTRENYSVNLDVRRIDFKRVFLAISGTLLFVAAPKLCQNVGFHYASGVCLGLTASLLIVVYLLSRLIPKRSGSYAVLFGGWSVALYVIQKVWENTYSILQKYQPYVIGYFLVCGIVSFAISYRFGPIKNPRTIHLLQWSLQFLGLVLVFISSDFEEAAMAMVLALLASYNFPRSWTAKIQTYWRRRFPPKIRLLTEEEYIHQGAVETKRALEELRSFCQSPDCNAWKTMSRLRNPLRFAEFVEGSSHLSNEELLDYEAESVSPNADWTDDESE